MKFFQPLCEAVRAHTYGNIRYFIGVSSGVGVGVEGAVGDGRYTRMQGRKVTLAAARG